MGFHDHGDPLDGVPEAMLAPWNSKQPDTTDDVWRGLCRVPGARCEMPSPWQVKGEIHEAFAPVPRALTRLLRQWIGPHKLPADDDFDRTLDRVVPLSNFLLCRQSDWV